MRKTDLNENSKETFKKNNINKINENIQDNKNIIKENNNSENENISNNPNSQSKLPLIDNKNHQINNTLNKNMQKDINRSSTEKQENTINHFNKIPNLPYIHNNKIKSKQIENNKNSVNLKELKNMIYSTRYEGNEDSYKVFIRQDGKPDYGNFPHFDDYVEFDPKKYRRPDIYFGYVHDQYLVAHILGLKNINKNKNINDDEKNKEKDLRINRKSTSTNPKLKAGMNSSFKNVNIKSLDDIMNKFNLKYIEPPKKEKIVEPPPEEEQPEEENKDNDKNKGTGNKAVKK